MISSDSEDEVIQPQGYTLTASQVSYLKEKRVLYLDMTKKADKDDIASKAGLHLIAEVETLTGSKMSINKKSLLKNVYYSRRSPSCTNLCTGCPGMVSPERRRAYQEREISKVGPQVARLPRLPIRTPQCNYGCREEVGV
jgi:hypothetical protein